MSHEPVLRAIAGQYTYLPNPNFTKGILVRTGDDFSSKIIWSKCWSCKLGAEKAGDVEQ